MKTLIQTINNERGSMLINAIATSVIVAIVSGVILQESLTNVKTLRAPRVKASMALVEGRLRSAVLQPSSFFGCDSDSNTNFVNCDIVPGLAASLKEQVTGCNQGATTDCGVVVDNLTYVKDNSRTVTATIRYEGVEVASKPIPISIVVPPEVLTSVRILCPPAGSPEKFLFKGFSSTGEKICEAPAVIDINGGGTLSSVGCPDEYYMKSFDQNTLAFQCMKISTASVPNPACTIDQMMASLTFNGDGFSASCADRPLPSTVPDYIQPGPF